MFNKNSTTLNTMSLSDIQKTYTKEAGEVIPRHDYRVYEVAKLWDLLDAALTAGDERNIYNMQEYIIYVFDLDEIDAYLTKKTDAERKLLSKLYYYSKQNRDKGDFPVPMWPHAKWIYGLFHSGKLQQVGTHTNVYDVPNRPDDGSKEWLEESAALTVKKNYIEDSVMTEKAAISNEEKLATLIADKLAAVINR